MSGIQNNSFTLFYPKAGFVAGKVTVTAGTPTLSNLSSGNSNTVAAGLVTIADNGTGDFTISVKDFKGPSGYAIGTGSGKTLGTIVNPQDASYSGNTLSIEYLVADAAGVASDTDFNFVIWAY